MRALLAGAMVSISPRRTVAPWKLAVVGWRPALWQPRPALTLDPTRLAVSRKSYGSNEVVLSGEVFVEASHIISMGCGDGRFLSEWVAFPWLESKQRHRSQHHNGAPSKAANAQEFYPHVGPS